MDAHDTTANNVELWASYFREQWRAWLDPFRVNRGADATARVLADVGAANITGALSATMSGVIARMYRDNAPDVSRAIADASPQEEPEDERVAMPDWCVRRDADASQREEWRIVHTAEEAILAY